MCVVFFFLIIITLHKLNYVLLKFCILCVQKNFSDSQRNISARQHCWNSCAYVTPGVDAFPGIVKIMCGVKLVQLFCMNKTQDGQMLLNFSSFPQLYLPFSFFVFFRCFSYLFTISPILNHCLDMLPSFWSIINHCIAPNSPYNHVERSQNSCYFLCSYIFWGKKKLKRSRKWRKKILVITPDRSGPTCRV